ncbi:TCP-1/cpn60 chaperonin family protein [Salinigranum salinum]|uniref:TCP-1/cpn60 chaperonin family protein n=1 Tax=Salinigranum salinum TaxID=1364937 RepID=UPI001260907D|nr:TCP-1/cpn60 chaperonin family protein [Salinigranum salinum]
MNDAREELLADVRRVCDLVGTMVGPFGTNKLVVEPGGRVTTTSSTSLFLDRLALDDPATLLLRQAANDFRDTHGDGATTLVLLTGALLDASEELVERGLHPTAVARGYRTALDVARERLDARARPLSLVGGEAVARTALTGTRNPAARARISADVTEAVAAVSAAAGPGVGPENVSVLGRIGGSGETELVHGVVIETPPVSEAMPRRLPDAGVALLSSTVDVPKLGGLTDEGSTTRSLDVDSFEDRAAIGEYEREEFRRRLSAAVDAGCRFVATEGGVNDRVEALLADAGITAIQRVDDDVMRRLVRATGGQVVPSLADVTSETLGRGDVRVERLAGREFVYVEADRSPTYTFVCRAPDPRSVSAFEGSVESAVAAVFRATADDRVLPGGGATEIDLERAVRDAATRTGGAEQLAIEAFGRALADLPRRLAVSAGLDGWSGVIQLRVAHHEGRSSMGVDALHGEIRDVLDDDPIVEPLGLKRDVLDAATDLAVQLLRIDERLPANDLTDDDRVAGGPAVGG